MKEWLNSLLNLSSSFLALPLALIGLVSLASCSLPLPPVMGQIQAGKENTQQIVAQQKNVRAEAGGTVVTKETKTTVETEKVDTIVVNQIQPWVLLLLILGWLLPTPTQIGNSIVNMFTRKKT